jgi:hypothetical protein
LNFVGLNRFEIRVEKSVWRSQEPKRPKGKGAVPVIAQLKLLLDQHWERCDRPRKGFIFSNELGNPMNLEALAVDVIRPALQKANLAWHGWHAFRRGLAYQPAQTRSFRQGDSANSTARKCQHDDEHLREDGECGCSECYEVPGNDVCNYCATREAQKYANHVEVFLAGSLQVSTLDSVRGNLAERGDSNPRYRF